jgi:hypothetical protein
MSASTCKTEKNLQARKREKRVVPIIQDVFGKSSELSDLEEELAALRTRVRNRTEQR